MSKLSNEANEVAKATEITEPSALTETRGLVTGQPLRKITTKETMIKNDENSINATTALDCTGEPEEQKDNENAGDSNTAGAGGLASKVDRYIAKIDPIRKSNRNTAIHKVGLRLRCKFGLVGDALEARLQEVNQAKCDPPLSKGEVKSICRSVDKSKMVPGQSSSSHNGSKFWKGASAPVYQTVTVISVSDVSVPVVGLLEKEVSTYDNCLANEPSGTFAIGAMLEAFKTDETIIAQIAEIRAESDKERRSELKKKLPAVVFGSEAQAVRNNDACTANGVLCLDFDSIPADELETAKQATEAVPYVFAVGLSASGGGLFALVHYEGTPDLKILLAAMQSDFRYEIDKSRSDLCGLRYVTFDENLIVKDEVFAAILTERRELVDGIESLGEIIPCGVESLDNILAKIEFVDWEPFQVIKKDGTLSPPSERDYLLRSVEQVLLTANNEGTPLANCDDCIYYFTGTHYKPITPGELRNFLIEAAIRCGVPRDVAVYHLFVDKIVKQFMINSARHNSGVSVPEMTFINLNNGTLFFDGKDRRFEKHSPQRFIRYCLHFDYDPNAFAALWQSHLDRTFPNHEKQRYVAMCLALPFYPGKIEKAPVFYGSQNTGKSTTLDGVKALYGKENFTTEPLASLTKDDNQGAFSRARLDGKLVNIASDISAKISDDGMAKMLISREEVSARHPYGQGFDMQNYARLIFAMNNLPPQFFSDTALTKRAAIVHFDQQISSEDIDTGFIDNIIANELPGVLNWVIDGLDQLLMTGRLDAPACCVAEVEQLRTELDPLSAWLADRGYQKGDSNHFSIAEAYSNFVQFCEADGYRSPGKRTFTKRLRDQGYKVERLDGRIGTVLYYTKFVPISHSPQSHQSPPPENEGETGEQTGIDGEQAVGASSAGTVSFPVHSPIAPAFEPINTGTGNGGNDGNENSEHVYDDHNRYRRALPITQTMRRVRRPANDLEE